MDALEQRQWDVLPEEGIFFIVLLPHDGKKASRKHGTPLGGALEVLKSGFSKPVHEVGRVETGNGSQKRWCVYVWGGVV